ncbi:leucine-rich repeat domain-containing protein [Streptacidiphilus sp. PB12-B1b]|uniref:STM4015 family protein n=1 Tax=Streptacidiphilus sp. PB12-B1b TaxID=2705012 RepID=UPI0015F7E90A|nr:STM4015 family protein [Streptacidiphilus sp. PB12-B1b]QMU78705.1 leucine-rich repeat domain-containing protein [Streptacidiphilus sp. PB12-B1b]
MYAQHLTELNGLPVYDLPSVIIPDDLPAPDEVAWRIRYDWNSDDGIGQIWERFLAHVDTTRVTALVLGAWGEDLYEDSLGPELQRVIDLKDRFPALKAFFLADLISEENEISWIEQTDLAPLLVAYPELEVLGARGGHREFTPVRHASLRTLRLESGGMSAAVVRGISDSELPALERLELWLGAEEYGADTTVADLAPLLSGVRFPRLRHLGLQDSDIEDAIAEAVAHAPVVPALETLALSMGVLTDAGAEALLSGQPLTHLKRLDLHHHFLSDGMVERLRQALEPAGVDVDLSEQEKPQDYNGELWHYVAVAE